MWNKRFPLWYIEEKWCFRNRGSKMAINDYCKRYKTWITVRNANWLRKQRLLNEKFNEQWLNYLNNIIANYTLQDKSTYQQSYPYQRERFKCLYYVMLTKENAKKLKQLRGRERLNVALFINLNIYFYKEWHKTTRQQM